MKRITLISTSLLALAISAVAQADLLYAQDPALDGNVYAAQNDPGGFGNFATCYDNFTLASDSHITGFEWIGAYYNGSPSTILGWTVSVYGDSAGTPGALLASTFTPDNGGETYIGTFSSFDHFIYGEALDLDVTAGTQYWVSVVPDLVFPPQWGWATGLNGDGIAYQDFFGTRGQVPDLSFAVFGTESVPEPMSMFALGAGALGLIAKRRKK